MTNDFATLDAQTEIASLAQVSAEESGDYLTERDGRAAQFALSPEFKAAWLRGE